MQFLLNLLESQISLPILIEIINHTTHFLSSQYFFLLHRILKIPYGNIAVFICVHCFEGFDKLVVEELGVDFG